MPNTINLTEELRESRGKDLVKLIEQDLRDRRLALQRRTLARNLYHGIQTRNPRYPGASNLHLPVVEEKIEGMVPKLVNAFHGAEPVVHVQRVMEEFNVGDTDSVERFLSWAVESDIPNFYDVTESWFRNMLLDGVSVLKIYWDKQIKNTVEVAGKSTLWRVGEVDFVGQPVQEPRPKKVLEVLADHFPGLSDVQPLSEGANDEEQADLQVGHAFLVNFVEDRREYEGIRVEIAQSEFVDEVDLYVYRPVITANRPRVEVIEYEDLIVPYRTWDIQEAPHVTHRYWLTVAEFKAIAAREGWELSDEDMERIEKATQTTDRHERADEDRQMSRQRDNAVGERPEARGGGLDDDDAPYVDGKLMMYEVYATDDLNEDGVFEEVVYQIPACLGKVVKAHYLEELFPHGRRPFADAHYVRVSGRWYSRSLGEQLAPINLEVDAIVNMVNEAQELINNPFFFYVPHANTVDPGVLEGIEPGQGIPVSDTSAVMFPKFAQEPLANLSAMDSILLFADRLTLAPQAVGSNQTRNAPRTARGTLALLSESGIKTDLIVTGLQKRGWKELFRQVHGLYAAFGDNNKWFRVTGEENARRITPEELRGNFDYSFHGNSVNTNREVLRSIAQVRYSTLAANPLFAMDMNAMLELTKDFLRYFGEGTDANKLTPKLPGQGGTHPPMDQTSENRIMASGQAVEVLPTDDHINHLAVMEKFSQSQAFEQLPQWAVGLFAAHQQQHQLMMQQQTRQGGPLPAGAGQANSVPTGLSNASTQTDLNALEGGIQ